MNKQDWRAVRRQLIITGLLFACLPIVVEVHNLVTAIASSH